MAALLIEHHRVSGEPLKWSNCLILYTRPKQGVSQSTASIRSGFPQSSGNPDARGCSRQTFSVTPRLKPLHRKMVGAHCFFESRRTLALNRIVVLEPQSSTLGEIRC